MNLMHLGFQILNPLGKVCKPRIEIMLLRGFVYIDKEPIILMETLYCLV